MQMRALVLQGFPTTSTLQSLLATSFSALPCATNGPRDTDMRMQSLRRTWAFKHRSDDILPAALLAKQLISLYAGHIAAPVPDIFDR